MTDAHWENRAWLAATALALAISFIGIFDHELIASAEPRFAGIGRVMLESGDAVVPRLGGEPFLDYPPLYFWTVAASLGTLGVSDGAARFPSAVAGFLTLLLCFDLTRRIAGPGAGVLSVAVLGSMYSFLRHTHRCMSDSWLTLFVLFGIWCAVLALFPSARSEKVRERRGVALPILGVYVAAALAFNTKGFIGLILIFGILPVLTLATGRAALLFHPAHLAGVALLIVGCAIWPLFLYARAGEAEFQYWFVHNIYGRIFPDLAPGYDGGHREALWFYLGAVPGQTAPWPLALPAAWLAAWKARLPEADAAATRFVALIFPLGFLLLSIPGTKRSLYLMPLLPPLAVTLGIWLRSTIDREPLSRPDRLTLTSFAGFLAALPAALGALMYPLERLLGRRNEAGERRSTLLHSVADYVESAWRGRTRVGLHFAGTAYAVALGIALFAFPGMGTGRYLRPVTDALAQLEALPPRLVAYQLAEEMRGGLPFYTGRTAQNFRDYDALMAHFREHPDGLLLLGKDRPVDSTPGDLASFRAIRLWEMAEGQYELFEFVGSGEAR